MKKKIVVIVINVTILVPSSFQNLWDYATVGIAAYLWNDEFGGSARRDC